ncbi:hypothetical protein [Dyella sp.]|uniref:hypothetical protein n=1 Tax=Dyella sp. TaxID=1869338 RepID=UPI002D7774FC|nr:hypothetical protein [Dyella sp.]HET7330958.1 hypothetical protein [Dyella sp.]
MRYRPFATLDVQHDYFADGCARHLSFSPHADTAAFLRRFDMVVRADERSLMIGVCETQLAGIWSERLDEGENRSLRFDIRSSDPTGAYYTDTVTASQQAQKDGTHAVPLQEVAATPAAPLATIALPLDASGSGDFATWSAAPGVQYRLHLSSRSTIWKYLLIGDWRGRTLSVVDQRGEVTFTAPVAERMPDGQSAWVTRSTLPIALRERPSQRFQLRDVAESPERVLISRLPGAQPQRLWREMLDGEPTIVSEIFVHS